MVTFDLLIALRHVKICWKAEEVSYKVDIKGFLRLHSN
jgi:hypothetical protein